MRQQTELGPLLMADYPRAKIVVIRIFTLSCCFWGVSADADLLGQGTSVLFSFQVRLHIHVYQVRPNAPLQQQQQQHGLPLTNQPASANKVHLLYTVLCLAGRVLAVEAAGSCGLSTACSYR
jgi:hypothetical protein